jgi:NADPH2:quinone reductase
VWRDFGERAWVSVKAMTRQAKAAHAVQISGYGPAEVLTYTEVALPPLAAHEVRIRTLVAAVNHTDLEIRAGRWSVRKKDPFPYVPGVEVVGVIADVGAAVRGWEAGQTVITMMQGLGGVRAERDGGYAEFVTVDADVLALVPSGIDPIQIAAFGLAGVTAYEGLRRMGPLAGKRILVTGAAGGVGSAGTAVARAQGASVVCLVSRPEQADAVRALGAQEVIVSPRGHPARLEAQSVDGVLDSVAGDLLARCVTALRAGGVLSLVGAVAGADVAFDGWQLMRPVTLTGYSSEALDREALRTAVAALCGWMATGALRPPPHQIIPLAEAARAHRLIEQGGVHGRVLLRP